MVTHLDFTSDPVKGTFRVTQGSEGLGCSSGTFVDHPFREGEVRLGEPSGTILKVLTYADGERSGSSVKRSARSPDSDSGLALNTILLEAAASFIAVPLALSVEATNPAVNARPQAVMRMPAASSHLLKRAQISTGACFVSTSVLLSASWSACDDAFYMRTTACLLVSIAGFAVAVGSASGTQRTSFAANADTCAFSKTGRKIGCVQDASNCSLVDTWTRGQWQFAGQELDPRAIAGPPPEVAAKRVRRGVWNIVSWPKRRALGRVAASNAKQTRWRITNTRGDVVATARGPDGAKIGMVILHWDSDVFC